MVTRTIGGAKAQAIFCNENTNLRNSCKIFNHTSFRGNIVRPQTPILRKNVFHSKDTTGKTSVGLYIRFEWSAYTLVYLRNSFYSIKR